MAPQLTYYWHLRYIGPPPHPRHYVRLSAALTPIARKPLVRRYEALLRRHYGAMKVLLMHYEGAISALKVLLRALGGVCGAL